MGWRGINRVGKGEEREKKKLLFPRRIFNKTSIFVESSFISKLICTHFPPVRDGLTYSLSKINSLPFSVINVIYLFFIIKLNYRLKKMAAAFELVSFERNFRSIRKFKKLIIIN